jgi:hypothetical protein
MGWKSHAKAQRRKDTKIQCWLLLIDGMEISRQGAKAQRYKDTKLDLCGVEKFGNGLYVFVTASGTVDDDAGISL